jgi:Transcriptional regulators
MEKSLVTRKDVAKAAGVSVSVVSRALNNSGYVAQEKKNKIITLAKTMGYFPNPVAMSLQQKRTKQILFFCKDIMNVYNIELYSGMVKEAKKRGYMVMLSSNFEFSDVRTTMMDGIIISNEYTAQYYADEIGIKYHLPVVSASYSGYVQFRKSIPIVEIDMYKVMDTAIQYLRKNGHRKIALGVPYSYDTKQPRILAWKELMEPVFGKEFPYYFVSADCGGKEDPAEPIPEEDQSAILMPENFFEEGKRAAQVFLKRKLDATAIVCFNDEFALGMMNELISSGIRIPEEISLIGIDGISTRSHVRPLLSTVSLLPEQHGAKCAELLIDYLEGKKIKYVSYSPIRLIPGETVKKLDSTY